MDEVKPRLWMICRFLAWNCAYTSRFLTEDRSSVALELRLHFMFYLTGDQSFVSQESCQHFMLRMGGGEENNWQWGRPFSRFWAWKQRKKKKSFLLSVCIHGMEHTIPSLLKTRQLKEEEGQQ
jgi:hypothetical protein